jgi:hypothetical protein
MTTARPTTAPLFTTAFLLNNEGIALMCSGKPRAAIAEFKRSLAVIHHASYSYTDPTPFSSTQQPDDLCLLSCVPYMANSCGRGTGFHLFDGVMELSSSLQVPRQENLAFFTVAVMLNLAVCLHQMGKMAEHSAFKPGQGRATSIFHKADRLYQAVQQVIEVTLAGQHQQHPDMQNFRFLFVAAQNNRLGIALEVGGCTTSIQQLKTAMDDMLRTIMPTECWNTDGAFPHQHSDHEEKFLSEFFLNSAMLDITSLMTTLPAPCA